MLECERLVVSCGMNFSLFVDGFGQVWGIGSNDQHQLGLPEENYTVPTPIPGLENISSLACGSHHSACLDHDGNVWTIGFSNERALGVDGHFVKQPHKVEGLSNIICVSCGEHTLCLDSAGEVWGLGLFGVNEIYHVPISNIIYICCSGRYSICIDKDENIFVFNISSLAEVYKLERDKEPKRIPRFASIVGVACLRDHVRFLDDDGNIWGFGSCSSYGGIPYIESSEIVQSKITNGAKISSGVIHTLLVDREGTLWTFGGNLQGQLGIRIQQGSSITFDAVKDLVDEHQISQLKNITHLSRGGYHTFCKDEEGRVWAFGRNSSGELCLGDKEDRYEPTLVPEEHHHLFWPQKTRAKSARK